MSTTKIEVSFPRKGTAKRTDSKLAATMRNMKNKKSSDDLFDEKVLRRSNSEPAISSWEFLPYPYSRSNYKLLHEFSLHDIWTRLLWKIQMAKESTEQ